MAEGERPGQGFFKRPFGAPSEDELLTQLRAEWQGLSATVCPSLDRPDHALLHFFQFSQKLDGWVREWGARADAHRYDRLRAALDEARQSLQGLLAEAKQLFETARAQRVANQQTLDQRRWQEEQARLERQRREADHRRTMAEREAKLQQTYQEINDIHASIRQNQRLSSERQSAMWRSAHFPDSTCACGRSKIVNQPCCWDCANRGRSFWF